MRKVSSDSSSSDEESEEEYSCDMFKVFSRWLEVLNSISSSERRISGLERFEGWLGFEIEIAP